MIDSPDRLPMRSTVYTGALAVLVCCCFDTRADAADMATAPANLPPPVRFVTHHQITSNGSKISFTATAGETYLHNDDAEVTGSIFSYAYTADNMKSASRPVMFVVGGGPGAASFSLQVGLLGPWTLPLTRLALDSKGEAPAVTPPFDTVENHNSLLDVTDLVFIDPVGTGYSRSIGTGRNEDFWGADEDLESLAQFVQLWLSQNGRWNSPKFFLGESYGGNRAAAMSNILMGGPSYPGYLRGITLNGVIIMSNGLGRSLGAEGLSANELAATALQGYAAAAWYHNAIDRKGRSLRQFAEEAQQFAMNGFLLALQRDDAHLLTVAERRSIVERLRLFTGLQASAYDRSLRISEGEFADALLSQRGVRVGVFDARYTAEKTNSGGDFVVDDASLMRNFPVFAASFMDLEHSRLQVHMDRACALVRFRDLTTHWNYSRRKSWLEDPQYQPKVFHTNAEELAVAMNRNESLYAMVVTGYFDLLMPPAQAQYAAARAGIPKERLILENVESGHQPYVDAGATSLINDIRSMVRKAYQGRH